jgi:hypothetical protein
MSHDDTANPSDAEDAIEHPLRTVWTIVKVCGATISALLLYFVVGETFELAQTAEKLSSSFGRIVFWLLISIYAALAIWVLAIYIRFPRGMKLPDHTDTVSTKEYRGRLGNRISRNPIIVNSGIEVRTEGGLNAALKLLDAQAKELTRKAARNVFVSTAVSQSGRLDALLVLSTQIHLIWQIVRLYHQRPLPGEVVRLYGSVVGAAFVAIQVEDLDIEEILAPVLNTFLTGAVGSLPLVNAFAGTLTASIMNGCANAYLTLRVGSVARIYCGALSMPDASTVRKNAAMYAAASLATVTMDAGVIAKATGKVVTSKVISVANDGVSMAKDVASTGADYVHRMFSRSANAEPTELSETDTDDTEAPD